MIKIDKQNFKIETDCKTVGEFMTEAAAFGVDRLVIKVDGCRYEFFDNPKIRVTDDTPIGFVFIDGIGTGGIAPDVVRITILSKPKPKTVRKSGWVIVGDCYDDCKQRFLDNRIFPTKELAIAQKKHNTVAVAKIEWEEAEK